MNVKLTMEGAVVPKMVNSKDCGYDLFSPIEVNVPAKQCVFINFGVIIALPKDTVGLICARSGLGSVVGLVPRNCVGVIDEGYRGELGMMVENKSDEDYYIREGDRIAQLLIMPIKRPKLVLVDNIDTTDRNKGGFGSTGR